MSPGEDTQKAFGPVSSGVLRGCLSRTPLIGELPKDLGTW